jgi:hypothetical protein
MEGLFARRDARLLGRLAGPWSRQELGPEADPFAFVGDAGVERQPRAARAGTGVLAEAAFVGGELALVCFQLGGGKRGRVGSEVELAYSVTPARSRS